MTQKWAAPIQVALPSFYRPRRRVPYNVGSFSPTYLPIYISYIHVHALHNADLPIFPGFPLVAENLHDNVILEPTTSTRCHIHQTMLDVGGKNMNSIIISPNSRF